MFRLENVAKRYRQGTNTINALEPTSLEIADGEFVAVVGPSGSGKSTLLTLLGGMLAPSQGRVWCEEQSIYGLAVHERAKLRRLKMGFIFQSFNLVPYLSAVENIEVPLILRGDGGSSARKKAIELLEMVGLKDRARHKPSELSAGQQQRIALARALVNDPKVIFADEPTGNLDPETRNQVFGFLDQFHQGGKTIIMVTHDPEAAQRATRQIRMASGRIDEYSSAEVCLTA